MIKFIDNIGDYFASNYFDEDFLRKVLEKTGYSAEDLKEFNKRISPLKDKYYRFKSDLLDLKRPKDKIKRTHQFHSDILNALGFNGDVDDYDSLFILKEKEGIPVRNKFYRGSDTNKKPHLFVMEMQPVIAESDKPVDGLFEQVYNRSQWESVFTITDPEMTLTPSVINEAISELFLIDQSLRPVFVLMLAGSELYLMQYEKWFRGSYLKFSLEDLFDEAAIKRDYFSLFYFLLSKETLAPDSEIILMEQLDEESHKSAYAVTQDLKEGVIKAIESLANEAVYYLKSNNKLSDLGDQFANDLKDDCLTVIYRLLFLFYAESRSELDILPINDEVYEKGYSLEMLRDLEQVPLTSESAKNGYFFNDSLVHLFTLLNRGYNRHVDNTRSFKVNPLDTPLFDDNRLTILKNIKFRNHIWQDIICQLSLSQKARGKARGRISYANLGINQLGSVYEGLLSYKGFFADRDYIEVKKADDSTGNDGTYVVPRSRRGDFEEDEILKDPEDPERDIIIPKGSFIYRLSGRDRQKSASYYTPEVLTQTVVKYTLQPILTRLEEKEIRADELLELKILEPAMGAAAFQNEVINQVAEAYLNWKQKEAKRKVPPGDYREELQKVKAYIATHNVYGVDINPTAIELGKLSLWLNVIHKDMETPFFGYRLGVGNAVVGAWRKVYHKDDFILEVEKGSKTIVKKAWWEKAPRPLPWSGKTKRKNDEVYHFLLPDKNMVPSAGIDILKEEFPKEAKHVSDWRKEFCKPISSDELRLLQVLCAQIDGLLEEHYQNQKAIIEFTKDKSFIWPSPARQLDLISYYEKESFVHQREKTNAPYFKLKMVLDYWCSLWFWDVRKAADLPTRQQWYDDVLNILEVDIAQALVEGEKENKNAYSVQGEQINLNIAEPMLKGYKTDEQKEKAGAAISKSSARTALFEEHRIALVSFYAKQYRFFHYELEFIEVFKERNGFDVIVGNPPWISIAFDDKDFVGEYFPEVVIRKTKTSVARKRIKSLAENRAIRLSLFSELIESTSIQQSLSSCNNFEYLESQRNNIYKNILSNALVTCSQKGSIGLLYPETIYDDPDTGLFREQIYKHLKYHFHFVNQLLLFSEIDNQVSFSINILGGKEDAIQFDTIFNLFHPGTILQAYTNRDLSISNSIKVRDADGKFSWNLNANIERVIHVDKSYLERISLITGYGPNSTYQTTLIRLHTKSIIDVYFHIKEMNSQVGDAKCFITDGLNDTTAFDEGILQRVHVARPNLANRELTIAGPNFYVLTPWYKSIRSSMKSNRDYDCILPSFYEEDTVPTSASRPGNVDKVVNAYSNCLMQGDTWLDYYKVAYSKMLNLGSMRTLQPSIIPPQIPHVSNVISVTCNNDRTLIELAGLCSSVVFDFYVKNLGKENLYPETIQELKLGISEKYYQRLASRALRLNCSTNHFAELWNRNYDLSFQRDGWSRTDLRLRPYSKLRKEWSFDSVPLRNDFERRLALVEIDCIVAMAIDLSLSDLTSIYEIFFPVDQQYESETYYDANGNMIFTINKGLPDVGVDRPAWEQIRHLKTGGTYSHTIVKSELYRGKAIKYVAPFEKCDRVEDYKRAWAHFEKVFVEKGKK